MRPQLIEMLTLQDEMNRKVHPEWEHQGFQWYRAIWTECAEMLEHYGWKWWKKSELDLPQVQLEVVDIWHFGLSLLLQQENKNTDSVADMLMAGFLGAEPSGDLRSSIEHLAAKAVAEQQFDIVVFAQVMLDSGMTFDHLYRQYIGKNVLNFFRQDHGYKQGHYIKLWQGREDNVHLVEVLDDVNDHQVDLRQTIYRALEARYAVSGKRQTDSIST